MSMNVPEAKRQAFVAQVASLTPVQLVYVNETGMDNRDDDGDGAHGTRVTLSYRGCLQGMYSAVNNPSQQWTLPAGGSNMIADWYNRELLAPFTVADVWNQVVFETWLFDL